MTISAALGAALATLTAALDGDGAGIEYSLDQLDTDASAAISGYVGLSIVVHQGDTPAEISLLPDALEPAGIRTSLHLTLPRVADGSEITPMDLIFYGAIPGSLVDLAADLAWLLGRPLSAITLDEHLQPPAAAAGPAALQAVSDIDQAIGVLIGRGHPPAEGRMRLQERAEAERIDLHSAALVILAEVTGDQDDPSPFRV